MSVRVRFPPSPTGEPHIGNMRTALFNWLFARHEGGQFILRIEDTDRARVVPEAYQAIYDALRWLGLDWDEGPDVGGPYAPYIQSQARERYQAAAQELLDRGAAYLCFCSPERLEAVRREQEARKEPPRYDRRCRDLSEGERQAYLAQGITPVVRFKTPLTGQTTFHDYLRGEITFDNSTLDDFIILKSDGFPTYHLAHMVDDHLMKITHVMRGDEWISSAPRHVLLYQAFGWEMPIFVHLPRILGKDRTKLSKRHGATSISEYRRQGYLPDALFNFLGLIGWSLDDRTEIIDRETFIKHFTLERIVKNPAIFDPDKLLWMNGVYIRQTPPDKLAELVAERLEEDLPPDVPRPIDRHFVRQIVPLIQERMKLLSEAKDLTEFFFREDLTYDRDLLLGKRFADAPEEAAQALTSVLDRVTTVETWTAETLEATIEPLTETLGLKRGDLYMLIRVAISGRTVTPPLLQSMALLGRERTITRLQRALQKLSVPLPEAAT